MRLVRVLSKKKVTQKGLWFKRIKAIQPIVIWYGTFYIIDEVFLVDYLWVLINRTVDTILIIDIPNFK